MGPARRWPIARIGTNASRRVFAPRTSLLQLHLKADDSVTWRPTGIVHIFDLSAHFNRCQAISNHIRSAQALLRITACHCSMCSGVSRHCPMATGTVLPISNASFLVGLLSRGWVWGWAGAWRIARSANAMRTGTLWNVPASPPPKSPAVAPGRGFPSFVVPLGQGNGRDTRVRVAVESHRDKEGRSFFMRRGK